MKGGVWVDVAATCNSHDLDLVDSATRSPRFADPSLRNAKTKKQKKTACTLTYRQLPSRTGQLATAANHLVS
jgi:acyl-CoA synthetase (AMP-forming)/AMP-acid ligase II